jgi:alginate O-acetyltransferase complex protein AlgI
MYFNLWVVFIISGFWHGAEWNFLIWGCYHGLFLVFDKLFLTKLTSYIGKLPRIVLTFFLVVIGWVFFRADNLNAAYDYLGVMFSPHLGSFEFIATNEFTTLLYVAIFFSFFGGFNLVEKWQVNYLEKPKEGLRLIGATFVMAFLLLASLGSLAATGFNPFIYFRF